MKKIGILGAVFVLTLSSAAMAEETAPAVSTPAAQQKFDAILPLPAAEAGGCCACPADPVVTGDIYVGPSSKYLFRGNDLSKAPYGRHLHSATGETP
jgi:hypothetical protein